MDPGSNRQAFQAYRASSRIGLPFQLKHCCLCSKLSGCRNRASKASILQQPANPSRDVDRPRRWPLQLQNMDASLPFLDAQITERILACLEPGELVTASQVCR